MNKRSFILFLPTFFLTILIAQIKGQSANPLTFGAGINSSINVGRSYYPFPSQPFAPYINVRLNKSEFLAGVDLFPYIKTSKIFGGQMAYRYHFLRENRALHFLMDLNFQYVGFQCGCGDPVPYDAPYVNHCADAVIIKVRSIVNTYGIGFQINFLKKLSFYSILGGGLNFYQTGDDAFYGPKKNQYQPMANFRTGLSFDIYKGKP